MGCNNTCKYCHQTFVDQDKKIFANHVRWCDKNTTNGDKGRSKLFLKLKEEFLEKAGELKEFTVICKRCQNPYIIKEREKRHPERDVYFCSRSCANSRGPRTEDFKKKVKGKLTGRSVSQRVDKTCEWCEKHFQVTIANEKVKCCSTDCSKKNRYKNVDKTSLKYYRELCNFRFNLADFPDEFDFSLVEKHGWYKAKNRGANLGGVSRDHIVSVKHGYDNGLDPKILSHPANCQLLVHNVNVSKGKQCHMTYEQLLQKIVEWTAKYGVRFPPGPPSCHASPEG